MSSGVKIPRYRSRSMLTGDQLAAWVESATKGDVIEYHRGSLARDRINCLQNDAMRETVEAVRAVSALALRLYDTGFVTLVQRRADDGATSYIAIRTAKGTVAKARAA